MARQKRPRAASGPAKAGTTAAGSTGTRAGTAGRNGTSARAGSTNSGRGGGNRTTTQSAAVRDGKPGRAATRPVAPAWFQLTTLVLSLAALGVSIYLTIVHYASPKLLVCSANGTINCEKVVTSPESMVFGVLPVAVLGLAFYVFMVAINSPWAWRSRQPVIWWARLGGVITGIGFVLYLLYAEIIQIGNICLWCTSVHVITFLLFVLLVFYATLGTGAAARDAR
jgi:uncharacterized membrane protein